MALRHGIFVYRDPCRPWDCPLVEKELKLELLKAAGAKAGIPPMSQRQAGYDHVARHAERLGR